MMDTKTGLKIAYRRKMPETLRTLSFAKEKHAGQYRKGDGSVPYIVQPLNMACHALEMGIYDDAVIVAALLHDVCEDCDIAPDKLGEYIEETRKFILPLLTETRRRYPEFYDACFLLKYQICCVINSLEAVLSMTKNRTEI